MKNSSIYLCLIALHFSVFLNAQTTYYVDDTATGTNNGSSWGNAFTSLQSALDAVVENDIVMVAEGNYTPTQVPNGCTNCDQARDVTFYFDKNIQLLGGYPNGGGPRNIETHETILNGDLGVIGTETDNAYHVITAKGLSDNFLLEGFTIKNGCGGIDQGSVSFSDSSSSRNSGAGMYVKNSNLTIAQCRLENNVQLKGRAAGITLLDSSGTFNKCVFYNNKALTIYSGVGAINIQGSHTVPRIINVTDCIFENNSSGSHAGAIGFATSNYTNYITNCIFKNNHAGRDGGALYNHESTVYSTNNKYINNSAEDGGAFHLYQSGSGAVINKSVNDVFVGNTSTKDGGAICSWKDITLINALFYNNRANNNGGGLWLAFHADIINATFYENFADSDNDTNGNGDGLHQLSNAVPLEIKNSIFWNTTATSNKMVDYRSRSFRNSIIQGATAIYGPNVINTDPMFMNINDIDGPDNEYGTPDDGLRLLNSSPGRNVGLNSDMPSDVLADLIGYLRISETTIDFGAYESNSVLGIEDIELDTETIIYPNPVFDTFSIKVSKPNLDVKTICFYDMKGRLVMETNDKTLDNISIANFEKGVYIVHIKTNTSSIQKKLIKQ